MSASKLVMKSDFPPLILTFVERDHRALNRLNGEHVKLIKTHQKTFCSLINWIETIFGCVWREKSSLDFMITAHSASSPHCMPHDVNNRFEKAIRLMSIIH